MSNEEIEKKSLEKCNFERLHNQIVMLRWLVLAFFLMGSACVGLLFTHLWHDSKAFTAMHTITLETKTAIEVLRTEMQSLHADEHKQK